MASLPDSILRIRNAHRNQRAGRSPLERREAEYVAILETLEACFGEDGLEAITEWIVTQTREHRQIPSPDAVGAQARKICLERDVTVPADAPFAE